MTEEQKQLLENWKASKVNPITGEWWTIRDIPTLLEAARADQREKDAEILRNTATAKMMICGDDGGKLKGDVEILLKFILKNTENKILNQQP